MIHPSPLSNELPLAFSFADLGNDIVYVIGIIGVILIVIFILGAIPMIPDLIRYIRIRNM